MDLLEQTKELCRLYNIKPARSKGQNFLITENIYDEIVAAADLRAADVVLEVGPGLGFLTAKLAAGANGRSPVRKVVAVELDDKLASALKIGLAARGVKNVEVINEDILKISKSQIPISKQIPNPNFQTKNFESELRVTGYGLRDYKIVANLPYNITSIFLRKFLAEAEIKPSLMVLMLQKEVAERICASPREIPTVSRDAKRISRGKAGEMSLLAVSVQFYAKPEIVEIVPKKYFWPEPEVDSAIIKLTTNPPNPLSNPPDPLYQGGATQGGTLEKDFFRLVKFGFSAKRKMLKNNLAAGLKISQNEAENKIKQAGFNGKIRAQELSVNDWLKLFSVFNENVV